MLASCSSTGTTLLLNSISNNPYLKRRKMLEDKNKYSLERQPKDRKPPRRRLDPKNVDQYIEENEND